VIKIKRWLTPLLALALIVTAAWGYWERSQRQELIYALEGDYQRAFYDLLNSVEQMDVLLAKATASNSPRHNILYLTDAWNEAFTAQSSMSQLPFRDLNLSSSRKFLMQAGDYCYSLARQEAEGKPLNDSQQAELQRIRNEVANLNTTLKDTAVKLADRGYLWTDGMNNSSRAVAVAAADEFKGMMDLEKQMAELPSMVYDGPFSDHLLLMEPRGITGRKVAVDQAREKALAALSLPDKGSYRVAEQGEAGGNLPAYNFRFQKAGAMGYAEVGVTQKGGHVLWLLVNRPVGDTKLTAQEAQERAAQYLEERGFGQFKATYSIAENNTQVITFAAEEQGVLIYPDQVKVQVALDNGQIMGFDATPYYMNHQARKLARPELTEQEIKNKVKEGMDIKDIRPAVIPLSSGGELLTYQVRAVMDGQNYLIYYNAVTGEEEQLFVVIEEPGGNLVM